MPKKPVLTPEEKKKLKDEKKIMKKLAIEEGKRQFKRDALSRELQLGIISRKKLTPTWHKILTEITIPQLKIELELLRNNTDLLFDRQDYIISILLDELDETEEQYNFSFRKHCENIQNLYKVYLTRLHMLKKEYDDELLCLHYSLRQQFREIRKNSEAAEKHIKTMMFGLSVQEKYVENMGRSLYMSRKNEQESKSIEDENFSKKRCEDKFEALWKSFTNYLENFLSVISEQEKIYTDKIQKDTVVQRIIKKQTEDIYQLIILFKTVKDRQVCQKEEILKKWNDLKDEKDMLQNINVTLKNMLIEDKKLDEKVLTNLVIVNTEEIENMMSIEEKAEKILKIYSIVRKYETQREKILAFRKIKPKKYRIEKEWGNLTQLVHFWQKCAQADAARNSINDEYLLLLEENHSLKRAVKSCLNFACNRKVSPNMRKVQNKFTRRRIRGSIASVTDIVYDL